MPQSVVARSSSTIYLYRNRQLRRALLDQLPTVSHVLLGRLMIANRKAQYELAVQDGLRKKKLPARVDIR